MKILMLVLNTFENDSRVERAARTLSEQGAAVTVFCVHRDGLPTREFTSHFEIVRCLQQKHQSSDRPANDQVRVTQENDARGDPNALRPAISSEAISTIPAPTPEPQQDRLQDQPSNPSALLVKRRVFRHVIEQLGDDYPITYHLICAFHSLLWFAVHVWRKLSRLSRKLAAKTARSGFRLYWRVRPVLSRNKISSSSTSTAISTFERRLSRVLGQRGLGQSNNPQLAFERRQAKYELFSEKALEYAAIFKPDVVHAHDFNTLIAAWNIQRALGIPYVYDSHELWVERNRPNIVASPIEKQWEKEFEEKAIR